MGVALEERAGFQPEHVTQRLKGVEGDLQHLPTGHAIDGRRAHPALKTLRKLVGSHVVFGEKFWNSEAHAAR